MKHLRLRQAYGYGKIMAKEFNSIGSELVSNTENIPKSRLLDIKIDLRDGMHEVETYNWLEKIAYNMGMRKEQKRLAWNPKRVSDYMKCAEIFG